MNRIFKIFIDFDGTITKRDIGEEMFIKFGEQKRAEDIIQDWVNEKINAKESWQLLCSTITNLNIDEFNNFIDSIEIDSSFKNFVEYCTNNNFELKILSDGLDYYIKRFLQKENLSGIPFYSNRLIIENGSNLIPTFPFTDEECERCANCKRNHILTYSSDDKNEFSIYIGDGWSDVCPAQYCDFIFAKSSLQKYCEVNRITYFPYSDFNEIIYKIDQLKEKKRLKKRYQAMLKRKEVYMQG